MILQDLDDQLRELAAADQLSGVALIMRGGDTVFEGAYGWASRTWGACGRQCATTIGTANHHAGGDWLGGDHSSSGAVRLGQWYGVLWIHRTMRCPDSSAR